MAEWEKQIFAINLIVGDLERSKAFYREVFGLAPVDEEEDLAIFRFEQHIRRVAARSVSPGCPGRRNTRLGAEGYRAVRHRR